MCPFQEEDIFLCGCMYLFEKPVNIYSSHFNEIHGIIIHCYHSCIPNCLVVIRLLKAGLFLVLFLHILFGVDPIQLISVSVVAHYHLLFRYEFYTMASLTPERTAIQYCMILVSKATHQMVQFQSPQTIFANECHCFSRRLQCYSTTAT